MSQERYNKLTGAMQEESETNNIDWILSLIAEKQRPRAEKILKLLRKGISWNEDGQLTVNTVTAPNSHIVDLVSLAMKPFPVKKWDIPGLNLFLNAVKENHVPRGLLSTQILNLMDDWMQPIVQDEDGNFERPTSWISYEDMKGDHK
jgi:hypothetical protein